MMASISTAGAAAGAIGSDSTAATAVDAGMAGCAVRRSSDLAGPIQPLAVCWNSNVQAHAAGVFCQAARSTVVHIQKSPVAAAELLVRQFTAAVKSCRCTEAVGLQEGSYSAAARVLQVQHIRLGAWCSS